MKDVVKIVVFLAQKGWLKDWRLSCHFAVPVCIGSLIFSCDSLCETDEKFIVSINLFLVHHFPNLMS